MVNFVAHYRGVDPVDLIQDGWSQLTHGMQRHAKPDMTGEDMVELLQLVDMEIMEGVRKRVETVVRDPATAESLKPWYDWLCKRPCFHDGYLDVFNQDNVTLVDTEGLGVDRIEGNVVVAGGQEIELDLLIFATGFELSPFETGSPLPVTGRDGRTLAEKWSEGATTLHGQHVHGFPNLLLSTTRQASWENNFPFSQDVVATHLATLIRQALDEGVATIEVTEEAEADWVRFHEEKSWPSHARWKECTPSYFNQEGAGDDQLLLRNGGFGGSIMELRDIFAAWRDDGMPGLTMTKER
jgi:cyclohexanone monooxygenase